MTWLVGSRALMETSFIGTAVLLFRDGLISFSSAIPFLLVSSKTDLSLNRDDCDYPQAPK
ncbi:hypothetical protein RB8070 [Rhodopirellula baltica SH 1]|uniref:Uncharacterized protein n=1 Tax=Rhodopirellula baltica (strain DSM 10527 / NCIMB 13988 / SH1) TaxID=243090 RepID=Q7UG77_RHOBA|nr:hypothetical protein RB8070 [Rhodopirellula baltica SH 1]